MAELAEILEEEEALEDQRTEEEKRFVVDDDSKAEWCLRKIIDIRAEAEKWDSFYKEESRKKKDECANSEAFFMAKLEPYMRDRIAAGLAKKSDTQYSYTLPSGKLLLKAQDPDIKVDNAALTPWLKENHPEFVKTEEKPQWGEMKKKASLVGEKFYDENGEEIPGVTATERPYIFKLGGIK